MAARTFLIRAISAACTQRKTPLKQNRLEWGQTVGLKPRGLYGFYRHG